jgi:hypothetical protein
MSSQDPGHENSSAEQMQARALPREQQRSYLLRVWQAGGEGGWRASLQSIPAGERHMFADLESLMAFLFDMSQ